MSGKDPEHGPSSLPVRPLQAREEGGAWLVTDAIGAVVMKFEGEGAEQNARRFVAIREPFPKPYGNRGLAGTPPLSSEFSWSGLARRCPPPPEFSWSGLAHRCLFCPGRCEPEGVLCAGCRERRETMHVVYLLMKEKDEVFQLLRKGTSAIPPLLHQRDLFPLSEDVKDSACRLLGHGDFTIETWDRLEAWLIFECARRNLPPDGAITAMLRLKQTEVADFLKEAIQAGARLSPLPADSGTGSGSTPSADPKLRKHKRQGGRPPDTDAKEDRRIAEAWKSNRYASLEDLAIAFKMTKKEVRHALDRHRHRDSGGRTRPRKPRQEG